MDNPDWLDSLRKAGIPDKHITRVADGAYEMLLFAADNFTRWYFNWPESTREARLEQAVQQAREYLDTAVSFHAPSRGYYWQLANCATFMHDPDTADRLRQTALETPVHHAAELWNINRDHRWGTVSNDRGYRQDEYPFEQNYKDHREILRFDPSYYPGLFFMGLILGKEGRHEEALVAYYGCLAVHPNDYTVLHNLGSNHWNLGHIDEALIYADKAIAADPSRFEGWKLRGTCHFSSGNVQHALEYYSLAM
jgi:tetratricopeptide (TPR) repeat protein